MSASTGQVCVWSGQRDADCAMAALLGLLGCIMLASKLHRVW